MTDLVNVERRIATGQTLEAPRKLRVVVLAGVWPHIRDNQEAANVVLHEILRGLLGDPAFDVAFVRLASTQAPPLPAAEQAMQALEAKGLRNLGAVPVRPVSGGGRLGRAIRRFVLAKAGSVLPGANEAPIIAKLCADWRADCALTVWSETATASLHGVPVTRMAYYGNPDHKVALARYEYDWHHRPRGFDVRLLLKTLVGRAHAMAVRRAHLRVMRGYDAVGDVAANDAQYYQDQGVKAFYIHNMWPGAVIEGWESQRDRTEQTVPLKIVGNVGNLSATGNTYGMQALVTEVLPALKRTLGEGRFEVHLFGGMKPHPYLVPLLDDPHVRVRGFVADIDAEIMSAPIFLVTNNHAKFKVGHTRFLHAWSLGACVVAFSDSAEAMPEISHRHNALLAHTPGEMAELVAEAAADVPLRRVLGRAGARTLVEKFDPSSVAREVAARLLAITAAARAEASR